MKKILKWTGIGLIIFISAILIYSLLGKEQTLNLSINAIDLDTVPDGTYNGSYDCYRWSNEVAVTVKDHKITAVNILKTQKGRESLDSKLRQRVIDEQKTNLDGISGATADSKAFLKAVENALKNVLTTGS